MNIEEAAWLTVPEPLLSAVAKAIDPNPTDHASHAVTDVPRKLIDALVEYMSEDLACDHSVNICMCDWIGLVDDLKLSLDGKKTCHSCGGDGASWDHAKYEAEMAAARLRGMYADDFAGMITCPGCGGSGAVSIK